MPYSIKTIIFILNCSVTLAFAIVFAVSLLYYGGHANVNYYNEGWFESMAFFIIGISGYYYILKGSD
jgi:hypothetical protein